MKDIFNPWVIAGAVLTASLLLVVSFFAAGTLLPGNQNNYSGGVVLTIIPIPTYTLTPLPTEPLITPTIEVVTGIEVGSNVQIIGTEGEGLRLRRDPSLNGEIVYLGIEGEIFLVKGGPQERDGYLWWQLVAPLNESRTGWAVSNFLQSAQSP
jgi:hypothetical protein